MRIGINDLSFFYPFQSQHDALEALHQYAKICIQIRHAAKSKMYTNLDESPFITAPRNDTGFELVAGFTLPKLLAMLPNREERIFLSTILSNSATADFADSPFLFDGNTSSICAYAAENGGFVASLLSHNHFTTPILTGTCGGKDCTLKNIATDQHLHGYEIALGRRIYQANSGKHKLSRFNAYGKGRIASPMDLTDDEAQNLLNCSVPIGQRFYGKLNGKYYTFNCTQDNIYHGYLSDDLTEDIRSQIDIAFA